MITAKVWRNKRNRQKLVTIPSKSEIDEGDFVSITKLKGEEDG